MASLLYPDDEPGLLPVPDPAAGSDGMAEVYRAITDSMERQRQQAQPTVADLGLFGPAFKYADNPVGTETTQSMGMPQPTTYAGLAGQFVDPNTGQLTEQGQARMDNPLLGFDTGGIGGVLKGYHGSPHLFPPTARNPLGEFDPMKIGTGEGNQAFGVGAGYLGEAENTAKYYRDTYGPQADPKVQAAGAEFNNAHAAFDGSAPVEILEQQTAEANAASGHMYEVNVNAEPEHFLDWDKPLSEQHPSVQAALNAIGVAPPGAFFTVRPVEGGHVVDFVDGNNKFTTSRVYQSAEDAQRQASITMKMMNRDPTGAEMVRQNRGIEAKLAEAGVPGIRYLDAGSRGAGEGSYNVVVFDPARMNIIRRYGIGALMAGGGAAALGGQQRQQQQ